MQANQQVQHQTGKNRRSERKMASNKTKALMADKKRDLSRKKQIMAETGTELLHASDSKVGNVAVGIGGILVSPPLSVGQVE